LNSQHHQGSFPELQHSKLVQVLELVLDQLLLQQFLLTHFRNHCLDKVHLQQKLLQVLLVRHFHFQLLQLSGFLRFE
jgi:hypothetical protein